MSRLNFAVRFFIAAAGASLIPAAAWACPACMVGDPKTAGTYFGMTLVMSALPILLVCGLGYWLWRRHS
jgi:membrane protein DedA with SNARE-associated domain